MMQNADPQSANPSGRLSLQDWVILVIAACGIAIVSLGVHDMMMTKLNIPFPVSTAVPIWAKFFSDSVRVGALAWFCYIARRSLAPMGLARSAIAIGVLIVMLDETLRVFIVDIYLTQGWIDGRWLFTVVDCMPGAATWFLYGVAATIIARRIAPVRKDWSRVAALVTAAIATGAIGVFTLLPYLKASALHIEHAFNLVEPAELYQLPYSFAVYRVIYSTFIEPTIAAFVLAALIWPGLPGGLLRKICAFVGLMLLIRGRVVAELLYSFWVPERLSLSFLSESQFFLETFVLCLLTGTVWGTLHHRKTRLSGITP